MKDKLGNPLTLDDVVLYVIANGSALQWARVVDVTDEQVVLMAPYIHKPTAETVGSRVIITSNPDIVLKQTTSPADPVIAKAIWYSYTHFLTLQSESRLHTDLSAHGALFVPFQHQPR